MHNQNPIYEIAIFTIKPEFINQMNDIRQGLRKVLHEFKGLISITTLQPINSNRVYADIAQWQTLKDAQVVAKAFEDGDERFLPYMKTLGACSRIENLLQKTWIWPYFSLIFVKYTYIRLKLMKNLTQTSFPSLRFLFSDKPLEDLKFMGHFMVQS